MKKKIIILVLMIIFVGLVVWGLSNYENSSHLADSNKKVSVVTTLFPLYDMAKNIGGDKVEVSLLLPPGVEPHSFEPKPSDVVKINEADVFIYTGRYMEVWAEDILRGLSNKNIIVVDSSRGIQLIQGDNEEEHKHEEDEEHEEHEKHQHGGVDPHIWLSFDNAQIMVDGITAALVAKDANNSEFYKNNADKYKNELVSLDNNYRATLKDCDNKVIVYGGHYAFGYLASRYGLQYLAAQGVSPDAEPTASDLAILVEQIRQDNIKYIFYEELASPKIAETIAGETDAKMLLLNAAHNLAKDEFDSGLSFFDILNYDLNNLKVGLECK